MASRVLTQQSLRHPFRWVCMYVKGGADRVADSACMLDILKYLVSYSPLPLLLSSPLPPPPLPQAISTACQNLLNPSSNQQQVLAAATVIAKHTSVLCNACKVASSKTSNPVAKRHFVQAAKEVANSTANLVKNIKVGFIWSGIGSGLCMEWDRQWALYGVG